MASTVNREIGKLGLPRHLVLGMDPGIASCGFALIDINNHEILEIGVRLFDSPTHPKTGQSLAVIRRGFRSTRRNIDRTQARLKHCLEVLEKYDVIPQDATKEFFHTTKGDKQPLKLRVEGLDRLLTNREWALVLYSLCKRRGYIPHGEGSQDKSSEGGKVLSALAANKEAFAETSCRTVGEWLAQQPQSRNRGGNYDKCVTHAQLIEETRVLFEAQRSFGSQYASAELEEAYVQVCDWERSRKDFDRRSYDLVGYCTYFPTEKRAARCTLTSELVAAYGALGNITIVHEDGTTRTLTTAERDKCIAILFSCEPIRGNKDCAVKFGALRRELDLNSGDYFKGVPAADEKTREVYKPKGWRALRNTLNTTSPFLLRRLYDDRDLADSVMEAVAYSSALPVLEEQLQALPLSPAEIDALCKLPYSSKALNGYGNRSKKALDMLLDCLEDSEVLGLTQAEDDCGLLGLRIQGSQLERSERLMPYEMWVELTGRTNNNPVVIRSMSQMRKVVNAICRKWGVPNEIHIELDRELRLPQRAKDDIAKAHKRNEKNRERIAGQIAELRGCSPEDVSGRLIEKYRLWEEQECFDLYTGAKIEVDRLISDETYTQIDHILPFSRTGENSPSNKVLVLAKSNQDKREQTPFEWMSKEGAPSWDAFKRRVEENQKLGRRKKNFLLEENLEAKEGEFLARSFTDTAYMSREVCAYLADCLLFPEDGTKSHVVPTTGRATAWLRRRWGLNFGINGEKDRSDDRHHATDACVIAACSRSLVIKTAKISEQTHWAVTKDLDKDERDHLRMKALENVMPWGTFANEVRASHDFVIPTRFVPHKGKGELFEQTTYRYAGVNSEGKDLARRANSDQDIVMGNAIVSDDGKSIIKVSEMLCLRLWHDPEAKKGQGCWYADPVYKADIPALKDGTYMPKIAKARTGRKAWKPVPECAMRHAPLEIYLGDLVKIGDFIGRFSGYNIANANWSFTDRLTRQKLSCPTVGKLNNALIPVIIRESSIR